MKNPTQTPQGQGDRAVHEVGVAGRQRELRAQDFGGLEASMQGQRADLSLQDTE